MSKFLSSLRPFPPNVKPLVGYRRLAGTPDPEPTRAQRDLPPRTSLVAQLPIFLLVFLLLVPQPSLIILPTTLYKHQIFSLTNLCIRLLLSTGLFLACITFLLFCLFRDPGRVRPHPGDPTPNGGVLDTELEDEEEMSLADFMKAPPPPPPPRETKQPERWCRVCEAPKPERCHHCSSCKRCVLKMDHHCVWLAGCVGFRTLPPFFLFLTCVTVYALHGLSLGGPQIYRLIFSMNYEYLLGGEGITVLLHSALCTMLGFAFGLSLAGFVGYHAWLISTNQTTLEQLHPYILTAHLPPRPPLPFDLPEDINQRPAPRSEQLRWDERYMNNDQRRALRSARQRIRIWDLGLTQNWGQVFGGRSKRGQGFAMCGKGDGQSFPRNPRADAMLERLTQKLERLGPTPESVMAGSGRTGGGGQSLEDWDSDEY